MSEEFIIAGWLDFGAHRDVVLKHFVEVAGPSRDEPGCLDYLVSADPDEPGRIIVFERWTDEASLVEHFKTDHIGVFSAVLQSYPRVGRSLRRYFVDRGEDFSSSMIGRS